MRFSLIPVGCGVEIIGPMVGMAVLHCHPNRLLKRNGALDVPPVEAGAATHLLWICHVRRANVLVSDLAVNDEAGIVLYLNNGDGTFRAVSSDATGTRDIPMTAIDINKDGKRDLAIVDSAGSQVIVLLGNGNGTFRPARFTPVSHVPSGLAVGDFDRDGKLDLAVACDKSLDVLLGNGDGTFAQGANYVVQNGAYSLVQTDLRHNNKEDLLYTDGQRLWVMYGNGNGTFHAPAPYSVGPNPSSLTVGDFNEDGAPDVAVSDASSTSLTLLLNLGGTRISLGTSAASVHQGQAVTFAATLTATVASAGVPAGTVAFKDGNKAIGVVHLSSGKASFTTSQLGIGTHSISVSYWETSAFNPHVSSAVTVKVAP